METRRQKQKQRRRQVSPQNYVPTKSRFRVEFELVTQNSSEPQEHLFFDGETLPNPFQSQLTNTKSPLNHAANSGVRVSTERDNCWIATISADRSPLSRHASRSGVKESVKREKKYQAVLIQQYGNSGRWRLITAVPELNHHHVSRRRKGEGKDVNQGLGGKKEDGDQSGRTSGFSQRFFRSAASFFTCHAALLET